MAFRRFRVLSLSIVLIVFIASFFQQSDAKSMVMTATVSTNEESSTENKAILDNFEEARGPQSPRPLPADPNAPGCTGSPVPVLVDLDTGVDDAFALSLLLQAEKRRQIDLLAITTVNGNTGLQNATINTLSLLHAAKRLNVPVYKGASKSLEVDPKRDYFFGDDGFGDIDYGYPRNPNNYIKNKHAVNVMLQLAEEKKGKLVIICLGPLTNYALAARMNSQFSTQLAQLVVMGGTSRGQGNVKPGVEFNFYWDPMAAFIAFNVPQPRPIIMYPWETCIAAEQKREWRMKNLWNVPGPIMNLLNAAESKVLDRNFPTWITADPLAVSVFLRPSLVVSSEERVVSVETHAGQLSGATIIDHDNRANKPKNAKIITAVDNKALRAFLMDYLAS